MASSNVASPPAADPGTLAEPSTAALLVGVIGEPLRTSDDDGVQLCRRIAKAANATVWRHAKRVAPSFLAPIRTQNMRITYHQDGWVVVECRRA
jgi:hypothetical protein